MADTYTTFCGRLDELNGLGPESGVASSELVAQVWLGLELVADCTSHEWAERVVDALNAAQRGGDWNIIKQCCAAYQD